MPYGASDHAECGRAETAARECRRARCRDALAAGSRRARRRACASIGADRSMPVTGSARAGQRHEHASRAAAELEHRRALARRQTAPERDVATPERAGVLPVVEGAYASQPSVPSCRTTETVRQYDRSVERAGAVSFFLIWSSRKLTSITVPRTCRTGVRSYLRTVLDDLLAAARSRLRSARNASSSGGEYGTGVSSAPMTRTGASSHSNASSWMMAASDSPMPPVRESSWTISTRPVWRATREHGVAIERREPAQIEHARLDARRARASRRRACATCTYAP